MQNLQGLIGVGVLILIACVLSTNRRAINWRVVLLGVLLQFVLAVSVLRFQPVMQLFDAIAAGVSRVISFADAGIIFLFGEKLTRFDGPVGFVFVVKVLPVIIFFASLMSILYHLGVMQRVVAVVAWALRKSLRITGVEALSAAANIFVGQTEAPLTVKPYIAGMTKSQLMCVMTGGFATIAGSVMAAYVGMLGSSYGDMVGAPKLSAEAIAAGAINPGNVLFAKHILTASLMSAPAGIVFAKIMFPETEEPKPESVNALMSDEIATANVVDAAATGATDGLKLALNVAAMLMAFVALLAMLNWCLIEFSHLKWIADVRASLHLAEFSLTNIFGTIFRPIAWTMGVAPHDCGVFGSLLGTQVVATEFLAYQNLAGHMAAKQIDLRSAEIATYALCGFANIPSIGIQIGGLSAMAPTRRSDLARIAPRAMVAGALACWMTGAVASVFI